MKPAEFFSRLAEGFRRFGQLEARGSSPLYSLLATQLAERPDVLALLEAAEPRQRRPNLLFAAVHDLVLSGAEHELAAYYPSVGGDRDPDPQATDTFISFVADHRDRVLERLAGRSTQTNEVRRTALLRPALHRIADEVGGQLGLIEVGASAGLLLLVDKYRYDEGEGAARPGADRVRISCHPTGPYRPPSSPPFTVGTRLGVDLNPLDATDADDARWLKACVWPEHTDRLRLLEDALTLAADRPPPLLEGDALDLLGDVIDRIPDDEHAVVFHAATLAYFPPDGRQRFMDLLHEVSRSRPLSWVSIEGPFLSELAERDTEADLGPPVDVSYFLVGLAHLPGEPVLLARGDPHGAWVQWLGP